MRTDGLAVMSNWIRLCKLFNSSVTALFLVKGLNHYALLDDDNAIGYFILMLKFSQHSNFSKLHDTVAHIALYSIYLTTHKKLKLL